MASHPAQPVLSEFYLGFPVIRNTFGGDIIPRMVESFGPLPAEWKGRLFWKYKDHWYDQDTKPNPQGAFEIQIKRLRPDIDQAELEVASSLFRRGFCLEPEKRPTAAELLQDPLFKALMDSYT
ncbi:hypothetical protein TMEN_7504 [Trichophyton mentagrophytes]|nr:hypothetical protein TMEN_7504 [Trichophyton mentagrophytes]